MNVRRVSALFGRELNAGPRSFMFIFAIVTPIILSLVLSLVFGTLFAGKPRMGVLDEGNSEFTRRLRESDSIVLKEFASEDDLRDATGRGAVDISVALPADFDATLRSGEEVDLNVYVWGESLLKNRGLLLAITVGALRDVVGQAAPVNVQTEIIGEDTGLTLNQRLLPLLVLIAVMIGGFIVPATSLVDEKEKGTLKAVTASPATLGDVFVAKGLLGALVSVVMGVAILLLNDAFGNAPGLLMLFVVLGAVLAACGGLAMGAASKDINSLFATVKGLGIFLYAPAIVYLFPAIPQWIGYLFPTYYVVGPMVQVSVEGASFNDVLWELGVLLAIIALAMVGLGILARRLQAREL